jgi:hypothetical protein
MISWWWFVILIPATATIVFLVLALKEKYFKPNDNRS